jgi:hypothetical protein
MPSDLNWGAVLNFERCALFADGCPCEYSIGELIAHYCGRKAQPLGREPIAQHGEESGHQSN